MLTVSDTRDETTDRSGAIARERLEADGHSVIAYAIVPDDPRLVKQRLGEWLGRSDCYGVIVNGGTGISNRDRTYEAVRGLLEQTLDGFGELFRMLSFEQIGSAAMLSRAIGGVANGKLLFCLPGSTKAVELGLDRLILPELGHLIGELRK